MTTEQTQHIKEESPPRKYFAMIPRMADEDLSLHEYRLYGHYSQICGQSGDQCIETERTTYTICGMGRTAFTTARQGLVDKGYIKMQSPKAHEPGVKGHSAVITMVDQWATNVNRYSRGTAIETPSQNGRSVSDASNASQSQRPTGGDTAIETPIKNNKNQHNNVVVVENEPLPQESSESEPQSAHPRTDEIFGVGMMSHLVQQYQMDEERIERICEGALTSDGVKEPIAIATWALKNRRGINSKKKPDTTGKWQDLIDDSAPPEALPEIPVVHSVVSPSKPAPTAPDLARVWNLALSQLMAQYPGDITKMLEAAALTETGQGEYTLTLPSINDRDRLLRYERNISNMVAGALEMSKSDVTLRIEAAPGLHVLPKPGGEKAS